MGGKPQRINLKKNYATPSGWDWNPYPHKAPGRNRTFDTRGERWGKNSANLLDLHSFLKSPNILCKQHDIFVSCTVQDVESKLRCNILFVSVNADFFEGGVVTNTEYHPFDGTRYSETNVWLCSPANWNWRYRNVFKALHCSMTSQASNMMCLCMEDEKPKAQ